MKLKNIVMFSLLLFLHSEIASAMIKGDVFTVSKGMEISLGIKGELDATKKLGTLDNGIEVWVMTVKGDDNHLPYLVYVLPNNSLMIGHMFTKEGKAVTIQYARKFQGAMDRKLLKLDDALHVRFGDGNDDFHQVVVLWVQGDGRDAAEMISRVVRGTKEFKGIPFDVYIKAYGDMEHPSPLAVALQSADKSTLEKKFFLKKSEYSQWLAANRRAATKAEIKRAKTLIMQSNTIAAQYNVPMAEGAIQFQVRVLGLDGLLEEDVVEFMLNTHPGKDYSKRPYEHKE